MKKYLVLVIIGLGLAFGGSGFDIQKFMSVGDSKKIEYVFEFIKDKFNSASKSESSDSKIVTVASKTNYKEIEKHIDGLNSCSYLLERSAYESCYSKEYKIPLVVLYRLDKRLVNKKNERPSGFSVDKDLRRVDQTKSSDYSRSGFDRGHMAENASLDHTKESQLETFLITNVVPQAPKFNRGAWRLLEEYSRDEANKYGYVDIISGAIPGKKYIKNHINIPSKMYKIIFYPDGTSKQWIFPNNSSVLKKNFKAKKYETTLKELSKITNFTFK